MLCPPCKELDHTKADCAYPLSCTCQHRTRKAEFVKALDDLGDARWLTPEETTTD